MRRTLTSLVLLVAAFALPAQAEVKDSSAAGFTVENSVVIAASPARVWQAMTADIDQWWPKDHSWWGKEATLSIDARAGGCFCEIGGAKQAQHLQVVYVDPEKTLRMVGGLGPMQGMGLHGVAEWTLQAVGPATRVSWRYRAGGHAPDDLGKLAPIVDKVQAQQLGGLAQWLQAAR
ncbi:SRPBCC family protein [Stenotrophomonas sp. UBA7606]|uniref:SRPBCC family protein n=1 Tax=Stenotrophomonas sp. UBA7606 TaxID=1947559 RepID=UPI0025DBBB9A|nr:SRPBCC domain-containing protein [Stenotrophomonas sp. UBA7606]